MLDWSAGVGLGVGVRPTFSPRKTNTRNTQEIPYLGEEGSSVRRMNSGSESFRYLEATGRNHLSLSRDTTMGTWNVRTMFPGGKAAQIATEMKRYNIL